VNVGEGDSGPAPFVTNRSVNQPNRHCVLLADRNHGLSEGMCDLLRTSFASVVMVADRASLFDSAERLTPSLVVVDLALTDGGGLDLITSWHRHFPDLRLIVLGIHDEASVAESVIKAGASAYVLKRTLATDLLDSVDSVLTGNVYTSPAVKAMSSPDSLAPSSRPGGN